MSFFAFSPVNTPLAGSGEQAAPEEYAGGVAVIRLGLFTVKRVAATPPKVTDVAPVKPDPRIVTGPGLVSGPP
jgi:hypothetical protein